MKVGARWSVRNGLRMSQPLLGPNAPTQRDAAVVILLAFLARLTLLFPALWAVGAAEAVCFGAVAQVRRRAFC